MAAAVARPELPCLVVDPVMIAKSGDRLLTTMPSSMKTELLPLGVVVTPNIPEAEALRGIAIRSSDRARPRDASRRWASPPW